MKFIPIVLIIFLILGCNTEEKSKSYMEKITPQDDDILAREMINSLIIKDFDAIIGRFDKSALGENPQIALTQLHQYIDHETPKSITQVGCNIFTSGNMRRSNLTYQIEFPQTWYTANIIIITEGNSKKVYGFHINKLDASLEEINAFVFRGKGPLHYLFLVFLIGIPLFIIIALIICIKSKVKRKWLWIIFIIIGILKLSLNWSTGQIIFNPLSFNIQLLGASFLKSGLYAPWIISISIPLGAIIFLAKRRSLILKSAEAIQEINYDDGSKYIGDIIDGKWHGQGTYIWPDGRKYVGGFENNRATGGWFYKTTGQKVWVHQDSEGKWIIEK